MTYLTKWVDVYTDGSIQVGSYPPPTAVKLWRKPHDLEIVNYDIDRTNGWVYRGDGNHGGKVRGTVITENKGMPEVYRTYPDHQTILSCDWQRFWRELNPELTLRSWSSLMDDTLAWMNRTGAPPRENCLTAEDEGNGLPAFDQSRLCGGALLKPKKIVNGIFYIEGILTSDPIPDPIDLINNKPWLWYWGLNIIPNKKINYLVRPGNDGQMKPVRVPILSREVQFVPLNWLDELPDNFDLESYDPRMVATQGGFEYFLP